MPPGGLAVRRRDDLACEKAGAWCDGNGIEKGCDRLGVPEEDGSRLGTVLGQKTGPLNKPCRTSPRRCGGESRASREPPGWRPAQSGRCWCRGQGRDRRSSSLSVHLPQKVADLVPGERRLPGECLRGAPTVRAGATGRRQSSSCAPGGPHAFVHGIGTVGEGRQLVDQPAAHPIFLPVDLEDLADLQDDVEREIPASGARWPMIWRRKAVSPRASKPSWAVGWTYADEGR